MRALRRLALVAIAGAALVQGSGAFAADREEAWIPEPMPRGFRVESSPMDGPVFANAEGSTLYRWPFRVMRNGVTGDPRGESVCTGVKYTESGGFMSPYPGGLVLPELDTMRPEVLRKVRDLVKAGATVLGKPPSRSPSLQDYPRVRDWIRRVETMRGFTPMMRPEASVQSQM